MEWWPWMPQSSFENRSNVWIFLRLWNCPYSMRFSHAKAIITQYTIHFICGAGVPTGELKLGGNKRAIDRVDLMWVCFCHSQVPLKFEFVWIAICDWLCVLNNSKLSQIQSDYCVLLLFRRQPSSDMPKRHAHTLHAGVHCTVCEGNRKSSIQNFDVLFHMDSHCCRCCAQTFPCLYVHFCLSWIRW